MRVSGRAAANVHILDAGCGSGRDAHAFQQMGHRVSAFDACEELVGHASHLLGFHVPVRRFAEVDEVERYDGIWACASLLHVPELHLPDAFERLWRALKSGGVLYCSFKLGQGEREHQGRHFTDADEARIGIWTRTLQGLSRSVFWLTQDQRPGRDEKWLNVLLHKPVSKLVTGGEENPFLPHLCAAIHQSAPCGQAVAFIKITGLRCCYRPVGVVTTQRGGVTACATAYSD